MMEPIRDICYVAWVVALLSACGDAMTAGDTEICSGSTSAGSTDATPTTSEPNSSGSTEGSGGGAEPMGTATGSTDQTTGEAMETTLDASTSTSSSSGDPSGGSSTTGTTGDADVQVDNCIPGKNKWTLDTHFDQGVLNNVDHDDPNSDQLQITVDGFTAPQPYMFVAQTDEGWMLKLDTVTGKQLARYFSVRTADCPACNATRTTWKPSRVAVDLDGDVYAANRAFGYQGSVTKIGGTLASCVDRNGNGTIETSKDVNNDGVIDVNNAAEFPGQSDECLLYTQAVGANDTWPRALTLDGKGFAWVGTFQDRKAIKLDISQAPWQVVKTIDLPSTPYGFQIRGNYLYASANGQPVMRVDLTDDTIKTMNVPGNYGLAIDQDGIAWFGGAGLHRCDFDIGGNCVFTGGHNMNGVAIDGDGHIWNAENNGTIRKNDHTGKSLGSIYVPGAYGVAIGHDGHPRVIANNYAARIERGAKDGPPGALTTYDTRIVGDPNIYNYTYSDFTGFAALNVTVKKGEWTAIHDSEDPGSVWQKVIWNDEEQGSIPPGTSITIGVRAAAIKEELQSKPFTSVVDSAVDGDVQGRFVEIRARLLIEDGLLEESPVLSDVCILRAGE